MSLTEHKNAAWNCRTRLGEVLTTARHEFLRAQRSESGVFTWFDEKFWIDRTRWLVLPLYLLDSPPTGETIIDDGEDGERRSDLEVFGGSSRWVPSGELLRVLGLMLAGVTERQVWAMTGAHLLNLAVVQPLLNPAFDALFWLAFARDTINPAENFFSIVGPMMFDMMAYPTRVPPVDEIRRSQEQYLIDLTSGAIGDDLARYNEDAWARLCTWQLHAQAPLMGRLFDQIESRTIRAQLETAKPAS